MKQLVIRDFKTQRIIGTIRAERGEPVIDTLALDYVRTMYVAMPGADGKPHPVTPKDGDLWILALSRQRFGQYMVAVEDVDGRP